MAEKNPLHPTTASLGMSVYHCDTTIIIRMLYHSDTLLIFFSQPLDILK